MIPKRFWFWCMTLTAVTLVACTAPPSQPGSPPSAATTNPGPDSTGPATPAPSGPGTGTETGPPPAAANLPAVLLGEWSASSRDSGSLELVLTADGGFRQYGGSLDRRGTTSVQGSRITFRDMDGYVETSEWSVDGGTLTLAGITYLRKSTHANGSLALAGEWMGLDDIYERLVFGSDGSFERRHDAEGVTGGTFGVQGGTLLLTLDNGTKATLSWSIDEAILTLRDGDGQRSQYARMS